MKTVTAQIKESRIPFPQRHRLVQELEHDLQFAPSHEEQNFSPEDLRELEQIHSTYAYRALALFGERRKLIESVLALSPLLAAAITLSKEETMFEFIREGGAGMYAILAIGLYLLFRELNSAFRLMVIKDHSRENLRIDTSSVLLGCLALIFLGLGWSLLGMYISASAVLNSGGSNQMLLTGVKESLTPAILSALLSALVVLAHYGLRRVMQIWFVPLNETV